MRRSERWAKRAVWFTLVIVLNLGCNPITLTSFLLHKDAKVPAQYPLRPKEGEKSDKEKEITVLVLTSQGPGMATEFAGVDRDLAREITKKLPDEAKTIKDKTVTISQAQVDNFKRANVNWKAMHPTTIGKKLGADFVLDVHLSSLVLYQPGTLRNLYEGRAEVSVDVYDTAEAAGGEPKWRYVHPFAYPRTGVRDATSIPESRFRMQFIENLAHELALKHIEHKPSTGIAEGDH